MIKLRTNDYVNTPSNNYYIMEDDWLLPDALMGGEKSMKLSQRLYLPQEPMEDEDQYINRLNRSTLKNFFAWAIHNHVGRVFGKPIVLSEDTPDIIKEYNKDLDLLGNNTDSFYREVFKDMLIHGISYVYVEFPNVPNNEAIIDENSSDTINTDGNNEAGILTLADELNSNNRPYLIHIHAKNVIKAVSSLINGRVVLSRLHILETNEVPDGLWNTKTIQNVRVIYPDRWELWSKSSGKSFEIIDQGSNSLGYIPIVPLYGIKKGFFYGQSPLQNLAYLNRAHWQSMSDQMNITHVARVPILFGTGFDTEEDKLVVGSKVSILGPDGSDLKYVEHSGKAIEAGMKELDSLEERIYLESLELINNSDSNTATSKSLDVSDANCSLQDLSLRLQDVITKVNNILCDWEDIEPKGSAIVSTDFGLHLRDGSESNILLKMRQNKSISIETFHREMKRRGLLSADFNSNRDIKLLKEESEELALQEQAYTDETGKQVVGDENAKNIDTGKPRVE